MHDSLEGQCTLHSLYLNTGESVVGLHALLFGQYCAEGGEQGFLYLQLEPGVVLLFLISLSCMKSSEELLPVGVDLEDVQGQRMGLGEFESRFKVQEWQKDLNQLRSLPKLVSSIILLGGGHPLASFSVKTLQSTNLPRQAPADRAAGNRLLFAPPLSEGVGFQTLSYPGSKTEDSKLSFVFCHMDPDHHNK